MAEPSYLYCGLDAETRELAMELETLGGGDATLDSIDVHAIIDGRLVKGDMQVLWSYGKTIGLRNALLPRSHPEAETMSYTTVTSTQRLSDMLRTQGAAGSMPLVDDVVNWALKGFNACVIAYGSKSTGKTLSLFGPAPTSSSGSATSQSYPTSLPTCYTASILQQLFAEAQHLSHSQSGTMTIGISAWVLRGSTIIDLCTPPTSSSQSAQPLLPLEFAAIECPDYETASRVIATCRARAPGVLSYPPDKQQPADSQRAHFFLRVIVHKDNCPSPSSSPTNLHALGLPPVTSSLSAASLRGSLESIVGMSLGGVGARSGTSLAHVHIVDLVGTAGHSVTVSEGERNNFREWKDAQGQQDQGSEADRIARRDILLQVQTFGKLLNELSTLSSTAQASSDSCDRRDFPIPKKTCARESKLTSILAPIIQGNCKTFLFAYLKDGEDQYKRTRPIVSNLAGLTNVSVPCYRVTGIALRDLGLVSPYTVLAPYLLSTGVNVPPLAASGHGLDGDPRGNAYDEEEDIDGLDLLKIAAGDWSSGTVPGRSAAHRDVATASETGHRVDRVMGDFKAMMSDVTKQELERQRLQEQQQRQREQERVHLQEEMRKQQRERPVLAVHPQEIPPHYPAAPTLPFAPATPTTSTVKIQPPHRSIVQSELEPVDPIPSAPDTPHHTRGTAMSVDEPHEDLHKLSITKEAKGVMSVLDSLSKLRSGHTVVGSEFEVGDSNSQSFDSSYAPSPALSLNLVLTPQPPRSTLSPLKQTLSPSRGIQRETSRDRGEVRWDIQAPYSQSAALDEFSEAGQFLDHYNDAGSDYDAEQSLDSIPGIQNSRTSYAESPAATEAREFFGIESAGGAGRRPKRDESSDVRLSLPSAMDIKNLSIPEIADEFASLVSAASRGVSDGDDESKYDLNASLGSYGHPVSQASAASPFSMAESQHHQHMQLRRNLAALLEALNEERQQRIRSDRALAAARDEALEAQTQYEVKIDSLVLEGKRAQQQLRQVLEHASMQDVASVFEDHVSRLCRELEELRRRNLVLEEKELVAIESTVSAARPLATSGMGVRHSYSEVRHDTTESYGLAFKGLGGAGVMSMRASHPPSPAKKQTGQADGDEEDAMTSAERVLFQASLRGTHASSKLRRLANENLALSQTIEMLRKGERSMQLQSKLHEQDSKKLKAAHLECARLQSR